MTDSVAVFPPGFRVPDASTGAPLSGGVARFYDAGTTTPKTVYSDAGLTVSLGTSVTTDALGYPTSDGSTKTLVYVGTAPYKLTLETSAGVHIASHDDVKGAVDVVDLADFSVTATRPVVTKSLNYTIVDGDQSKVVAVNCSGGDVTLTLPSAVTVGDGWLITAQHAGSANQAIVSTVSSQTISDGVTSYGTSLALALSGEEVTLVSDGGNWRVIGHTTPLLRPSQGVLAVVDRLSAPPGAPQAGALYLLTSAPSGAWSSFAEHDIAQWTGAAWVKFTPATDCGWIAFVADEDRYYRHVGTAWAIDSATTSAYGTVQLADAAAMEAKTAGRAVTADLQDRHPAHPKAWVTFNGTGTPAISSSYNVTSITDNGVGDYTINLGVTFSSTNFAWSGGANFAATAGVNYITDTARTTSSLRITVASAGSAADLSRISLVFWGDV